VIPGIAGLATASGAAEVTDAFRMTLVIAAGIAAAASPLCFVGLNARTRCHRTLRRYNCPVDGTPLQPDPQRCPELIPSH
jgi:hypothetical protein